MEVLRMIKNGRPYTNENGAVDDELISALPKEKQDTLLNWICQNLLPRKTVLQDISSYGLKHKFEHGENGFYLTNNMFKDAMMKCGYEPYDPNELNWHYGISKKSPVFSQREAKTTWTNILEVLSLPDPCVSQRFSLHIAYRVGNGV